VDFYADGQWYEYRRFTVEPGRSLEYAFPAGYAAHWLRLKASVTCKTTAQFLYE
jgi:hypothetical protein